MTGSDTTGPAAIPVQQTSSNPGSHRHPAAATRPRRSRPSELADRSGRPEDRNQSRPDATDIRRTGRFAARASELSIYLVGEKSQVLKIGKAQQLQECPRHTDVR